MSASGIPEGYTSVIPYLIVERVPAFLDFLRDAFAAEPVRRMDRPDGTVQHAEVRIGGSLLMMGERGGDLPALPGSIHLYVPDVDRVYERALAAGAESISPPRDLPYGDRSSGVRDAWGNHWWIATHLG